jgi:tripartite-type tricarboxylate transporter receptor subunit TctC
VKWVVGYPPGGATDIIARLIGQRLSERLGQQFIIENKPGAGNNIATESVINAEPGRLHGAADQSAQLHQRHALHQPEIQRRSRHRADRGAFNRVPNVMTVAKDVPAKNVASSSPM